ncbi:HK97-gp10 family putative phage morphogenesis protein [uncultured Massilia sp.]|uniref:HK97-gp10 family putative phage morphogenesis protein n=1 Tax=uncultured Massilia sp. TaxID=169973 RepID=UPI00258E43B0|nr:HK97-gp10 family putative phage morphogenesis protein [uncultured Massilia sp.]
MIRLDGTNLADVIASTVQNIRDSVDEPTLRKVGFAGAEIFREEAKQNALAHAKTYTIHRNIIVKRLEEQSDGGTKQVYLVTVRQGEYGGGDAFYWRFVEKGHKFVPRNNRRSKKTGKKIGWAAHRYAAELEYGTASAPAYPFMRPAYESKKAVATNAMTTTLAEQLARNARGNDR